jgi:Ca2+-binding EF-hand superfamily protein
VKNPLDAMFDWNGDGYIDGLEHRTAGRILIREQLRRLPLLDPDMAQLFDIHENGYLQFWETGFVYSVVVWNSVWPEFADRVDADHDGEVAQGEVDGFIDRVCRVIAHLPLNPEDAAMYRWRGKQALFEWTDLDGNGKIDWLELLDLGARVTELVDADELPYPLNSSLADYFDRNRDGSIGKAEVDTMRQVLILEQLDLLFVLDIYFREHPLKEVLDLNENGRFDETERSMLLDLFYSKPGAEERRASTALEKKIDPNQDGFLESGEHHNFETTVMGALAIAWVEKPEEELAPKEGWAVRSPLDELADLNGDGLVDQTEDRQMAEGLGSPHPVRTPFDRRIDFNGNGEVETFEIVKARRIAEPIDEEAEGTHPVRTIMDDHLDLNNDSQVDELEIERVLRFLKGETDALDHRSKLYRVFDLNDNGTISEAELVKGIDLYLLPRPVNPDEPFDSRQDRNRDGFLDPEEIGIAAGVSARGDIPTIPERLERMEWITARDTETTAEAEKQRLERYEYEFYTKLGRIQDQKLAVVGITSRTKKIDEETASGVMVFIENAFVNVGKVRVVDRENIAKIVKEYEFQGSDLTDESTAVEIGKLSGADIIVIGSISNVGEIFYLNIKLISVETAEIIGSSIADAVNAKEFYEMCNEAVFKLF